jgi:hypothetical protein
MEVPALGSPRDLIYRDFMMYESKLDAKKHELNLLIALASPFITETTQRRAWDTETKRVFNEYVSLMLGQEVVPVADEVKFMQEYYAKVVKPSAPTLTRGKDGKLAVTGLPKEIFP